MRNIILVLTFGLVILTGPARAQNLGYFSPEDVNFASLAFAGPLPVQLPDDVLSRTPENCGYGRGKIQEPAAVLMGTLPETVSDDAAILFRVNGEEGGEKAARLCIYNLQGQEVALLVDNLLEPDNYQVRWDGHDSDARPVPGGIYFSRLVVDGQVFIQKVTVDR